MKKKTDDQKSGISRREFLGTGAVAGAATILPGTGAAAQESAAPAGTGQAKATPLSDRQMEREVGASRPPTKVQAAVTRPGSDLMVEVLRDLGIEFVISNPGSSFEGLQESIVNHGEPPNVMPEFITALHEESAVDMAHGYARCEGKPVCALVSGTMGAQHASMAVYQAFLGEAPVILVIGRDDEHPRQSQTADDIVGLVRAFTKWDSTPTTLEEALDAFQEAYRQATTPPCAPVAIVLDAHLQKQEAGDVQVPSFVPASIPSIDRDAAQTIASALLRADNPHINVGRFRTPEGIARAVELAELVGATTSTQATRGPMSFPQTHPLTGKGEDENYDYILGLETSGAQASVSGPGVRSLSNRDESGIGLGTIRPPTRPGRNTAGAMDLEADAEASLPILIAAVKETLDDNRRRVIAARRAASSKANRAARARQLRAAAETKRAGWNGSPVATARIYAELWPLIKDHDWCLASPAIFSSFHNVHLWDHDRPYSYLGQYPAAALGYCVGACAGAGLAAKKRNRIVINIQGDGDFNYAPGAIWTMAHHQLPVLTIMHNNRGYHMELMYLQYMAGVRGRGTDRMHIGTTFRNPHIDYAKIADGYGVKNEGPIDDPTRLQAALQRGVASVLAGEPYLIDVLTQPR